MLRTPPKYFQLFSLYCCSYMCFIMQNGRCLKETLILFIRIFKLIFGSDTGVLRGRLVLEDHGFSARACDSNLSLLARRPIGDHLHEVVPVLNEIRRKGSIYFFVTFFPIPFLGSRNFSYNIRFCRICCIFRIDDIR